MSGACGTGTGEDGTWEKPSGDGAEFIMLSRAAILLLKLEPFDFLLLQRHSDLLAKLHSPSEMRVASLLQVDDDLVYLGVWGLASGSENERVLLHRGAAR